MRSWQTSCHSLSPLFLYDKHPHEQLQFTHIIGGICQQLSSALSEQRSHRREVGIVPACIVKTIPTNEAVRRLTPRDRGPTSSSCCNVFRTCTLPLMDLIITCQHQQENHPHQSQNTVVLVLSNCNLSSSKPLACSFTEMTEKSNSLLTSIIKLVTPFNQSKLFSSRRRNPKP